MVHANYSYTTYNLGRSSVESSKTKYCIVLVYRNVVQPFTGTNLQLEIISCQYSNVFKQRYPTTKIDIVILNG